MQSSRTHQQLHEVPQLRNESTQRLSCQPEPLSNHEQPTAWENSSPTDRYNTSKSRDRLFSTMFLMAPLQRCPLGAHHLVTVQHIEIVYFSSSFQATATQPCALKVAYLPGRTFHSPCLVRLGPPLPADLTYRCIATVPHGPLYLLTLLRPSCSTFPMLAFRTLRSLTHKCL